MIDKRYVFQAQSVPYLYGFLCIFLPFLMKSKLRHKDQRHLKCDAKRKGLIARIISRLSGLFVISVYCGYSHFIPFLKFCQM